jgi:hypothetical protein
MAKPGMAVFIYDQASTRWKRRKGLEGISENEKRLSVPGTQVLDKPLCDMLNRIWIAHFRHTLR